VKKHGRYYSSSEKCHFTSCITIFSALKVGHQGSSAVQGSWATFSAETLAPKSANLRCVLPYRGWERSSRSPCVSRQLMEIFLLILFLLRKWVQIYLLTKWELYMLILLANAYGILILFIQCCWILHFLLIDMMIQGIQNKGIQMLDSALHDFLISSKLESNW
jgi:hypothetical protein